MAPPGSLAILILISIISASGVAFLIYFGFALWFDMRRAHAHRVLVLRLRDKIARRRQRSRPLYVHNLETIRKYHDRTQKL
jgi:hypothetical protein